VRNDRQEQPQRGLSAAWAKIARASFEAQRRGGEMLAGMEKQDGGHAMKARFQNGTEVPPRHRDLGISKKQAMHWQRYARVPEDKFAAILEESAGSKRRGTRRSSWATVGARPRRLEYRTSS